MHSSMHSSSSPTQPFIHPFNKYLLCSRNLSIKYGELCWISFVYLFRFIPYHSHSPLCLRWQIIANGLIWAPSPPSFWLSLKSRDTWHKTEGWEKEEPSIHFSCSTLLATDHQGGVLLYKDHSATDSAYLALPKATAPTGFW